ncbi:hypothetical protein Gpo141_00009639 [Globisporangium polare]
MPRSLRELVDQALASAHRPRAQEEPPSSSLSSSPSPSSSSALPCDGGMKNDEGAATASAPINRGARAHQQQCESDRERTSFDSFVFSLMIK